MMSRHVLWQINNGAHGAHLEGSRARLITNENWKKRGRENIEEKKIKKNKKKVKEREKQKKQVENKWEA